MYKYLLNHFILYITVELEQFTDCFHIVFQKLEHSRKAKKFLDARNFYGGNYIVKLLLTLKLFNL